MRTAKANLVRHLKNTNPVFDEPCSFLYLPGLCDLQDIKVPGLMYGLCAATTFLSIASLVPIPETRGVDLKDKIASSRECAAEVSEIEARGPLK